LPGPYQDARPADLRVPSRISKGTRKDWKYVRLEDKAYIVKDHQAFVGPLQFYVTGQSAKRYGGTLINDGAGPFSVFFESSYGYYSEPAAIEPGAHLDFQNYPLGGITLLGSGTYTLIAWASRSTQGYVRRVPVVAVAAPGLLNVNIADVAGSPPSCLNPLQVQLSTGAACYDARQIRALTAADVVTVDQGTIPWADNISQWFGSTAPTVGQKLMASSIPVVIASDQSAIPVSLSAAAGFFPSGWRTGTTSSTPAAGAEISFSVPNGQKWQILSVYVELVTAVAVATRSFSVFFGDNLPASAAFLTPVIATQAASLTRRYSFGTGVPLQATLVGGGIEFAAGIPPLVLTGVTGNVNIATNSTNLQAADQYFLFVNWLRVD
jgi:hypothetical protein